MRRAYLVLLLAAAAAVVFLFVRDDDAPREDPGTDESRRDAAEAAATLRGAGRTETASAADAPQAAQPEAHTGKAAAFRVLLPMTVDVAGKEGKTVPFAPTATLAYFPIKNRTESIFGTQASMEISSTGTHTLDVTESIGVGARDADVTVRHPDYLPVTVRVPAPKLPQPLEGDVLLEPMALTLRPARVLTGRIVGPDEQPAPGAALLYRMRDGVPSRVPVSRFPVGADGRFWLQYGSSDRYLVVAVATRTGEQPYRVVRLRPAGEIVDLEMTKAHRKVTLRVQRGESITGRVLDENTPANEATVQWRTTGHPMSMRMDESDWEGARLSYADGLVHWGQADAETDAEGKFGFHGLSARSYELTIGDLPGVQVHRQEAGQMSRVVTAPNHDVVFDLRLARIEIRATLDGQPAVGVNFGFTAIGHDPNIPDGFAWDTAMKTTNGAGKITHRVSPKQRYDIAVVDDRFRAVRREITTPAAGKTHGIDVELAHAPPKPLLIVTLSGEGSQEVTFASFGFYPIGSDPRSQTPSPIRRARIADGRFVLKEMPAGRFRLHVRPGRQWHEPPNEWMESTTEVEIPRIGEGTAGVRIRQGGRLLVTVTDADGRHLQAGCSIRNAVGAEIPAWFSVYNDLGGRTLAVHRLPGVGACWVEPVLAPGAYTLAFALDGFHDETREVELKPGEATPVRVQMKPLR